MRVARPAGQSRSSFDLLSCQPRRTGARRLKFRPKLFLRAALFSTNSVSCHHSVLNSRKGDALGKDRFVSDQNIERCRRLACAALSGRERGRLLGLWAEEEDNFIDLQKA